jgi:hypothetical protein
VRFPTHPGTVIDVPLRLSRLIGWTTLVAWLVSAIVPSLSAHAVGGTECEEAPLTSHHDTPQFEGLQRAAGQGHCAVCHFYRDLRTAQHSDTRFVHQIAPLAIRAEAPVSLAPPRAARYSPSRAPPTSLA